jgi:hypothetical protein
LNTGQELRHRHRRPSNPRTHSQHATSCRTSSAQSIPQDTFTRFLPSRALSLSALARAARGHARSLMEGLAGTAIRSAVRDLSCPQGPGPGQNSKAPGRVRGLVLRVARATTTHTGPHRPSRGPGRRVAPARRRDLSLTTGVSAPGIWRRSPAPAAATRPGPSHHGHRSATSTEGLNHAAGSRDPAVFIEHSSAGAGQA